MGAGQGLALESQVLISSTSGLKLGLGNSIDLLHGSSRVRQKHGRPGRKAHAQQRLLHVSQGRKTLGALLWL